MSIFVSASGLSDFISCQNKSYYRIFQPAEAVPTVEMLMGTVAHKVIEKKWNDREVASKMAYALVKEHNLSRRELSIIDGFIDCYFKSFHPHLQENDLIEHRFKVNLWQDVYLVGVMDRVSNGVVYDWKTGTSIPKRLDNNVQFILYNLAYKMLFNSTPNGLYLASLRTGELIRYKESKLHSEELIGKIIPQYVNAVKNKTFVKGGLFNGACYRCQFKKDCLSGEEDVVANTESFTE